MRGTVKLDGSWKLWRKSYMAEDSSCEVAEMQLVEICICLSAAVWCKMAVMSCHLSVDRWRSAGETMLLVLPWKLGG